MWNMLDHFPDATFVHDAEGNILAANRRACQSLGYSRAELLSLSMQEVETSLHSGASSESPECRDPEFRDPDEPLTVNGVHRRKDGTTFPVEVGIGLLDESDEGLVVRVVRDLSERRKAEVLLRESERRFRQLFEHSSDALLVHDERGNIVDCNAEACRSLGYSRTELLSLSVKDFVVDLIPDEEKKTRTDTPWRLALREASEVPVTFHENEHRRKDGTTFPVEVGIGAIDHDGARLILASCRDVSERRALEEKLAHRATHDPLTDLPNREFLAERLRQALSRAARRSEKVAVLFVDLDGFKSVNDRLGHRAGDGLLVAVGDRLRRCVRTEDTVSRLGGDEFVIVLEDVVEDGEASRIANRVLESMRGTFMVEGREISVTASVGVVLNAPSEKTTRRERDLIRDADEAMYRAKRDGKDRYALIRVR